MNTAGARDFASIDAERLQKRWRGGPLAPWAALLPAQLAAGLCARRYGDLPRWQQAVRALPAAAVSERHLDTGAIRVGRAEDLAPGGRDSLLSALRGLHPWRKGPFELFGIHIDAEWRSDWKWDRLAAHIEPLSARRVLDVGCGNGYHCWRMRGAGAAEVIGIDPSPLFTLQFQALQRYLRDPAVCVLPVGIEALPGELRAFDTVFSMGVLYHRRSPLEHLRQVRGCLRPGGQLVLETLVIEGDATRRLIPAGRYARMRNVWCLPSSALLLRWLRQLGWRRARLVDETVTSVEEQRSSAWMRFHSLADFLDPEDSTRTIEGYPAPRRAIVVAQAP